MYIWLKIRLVPFYFLGLLLAFGLVKVWASCGRSDSSRVEVTYTISLVDGQTAESWTIEPDRQSDLLVFHLVVRNDGYRDLRIAPEEFYITIEGREYRPYRAASRPDALQISMVADGRTVIGSLTFEIPGDLELELDTLRLGCDPQPATGGQRRYSFENATMTDRR